MPDLTAEEINLGLHLAAEAGTGWGEGAYLNHAARWHESALKQLQAQAVQLADLRKRLQAAADFTLGGPIPPKLQEAVERAARDVPHDLIEQRDEARAELTRLRAAAEGLASALESRESMIESLLRGNLVLPDEIGAAALAAYAAAKSAPVTP